MALRTRLAACILFTLLAGCGPALTASPTVTASPPTVTPTVAPTIAPTPTPRGGNLLPDFAGPLPAGAVARLGQGRATAVSVSPDGASVAVGTSTGVLVYDAATLSLTWSALTTESVTTLAWRADSLEIAAGARDGRVRVWRSRSGLEVLDLASDDGAVTALDWSPDGTTLVSSGAGGISTIRDGLTGHIRHRLEYHEITDAIAYTERIADVDAALSPDGRLYATHYNFGGLDGPKRPGSVVVVWDLASGAPLFALNAANEQVASLAWSPDSRTLASGSDYVGLIGLWDVTNKGKLIDDLIAAGTGNTVHWSPDGTKILAGTVDQTSVVFDVASEEQIATIEAPPGGHEFLGWSADGGALTMYDRQARVTAYDASTGQPTALPGSPPRYFVRSGDKLQNVDVWDAPSGALVARLFEGTSWVYRVAWSPGGDDTQPTPSPDEIRWWSPDGPGLAVSYYVTPGYWTGGCVGSLFMVGDADLADVSCPSDRAISPDGSVIAIVYNRDNSHVYKDEWAGVISIHDYKSGARLRVLRGHASFITSLAYSPDGKLLASGSDDGTVIVWDMSR